MDKDSDEDPDTDDSFEKSEAKRFCNPEPHPPNYHNQPTDSTSEDDIPMDTTPPSDGVQYPTSPSLQASQLQGEPSSDPSSSRQDQPSVTSGTTTAPVTGSHDDDDDNSSSTTSESESSIIKYTKSEQYKKDKQEFIEACKQGRWSDIQKYDRTYLHIYRLFPFTMKERLSDEEGRTPIEILKDTRSSYKEERAACLQNLKEYDLFDACAKGKLDDVQRLIKEIDDINWINYNFDGEDDYDTRWIELDNGNVVEVFDCSFIHIASVYGHSSIVKELLLNGADVDFRDLHKKTALMYACKSGHDDVALILIENKADVNAKDMNDRTPLMYACQSGLDDVADMLIENEADISATDDELKTPLMYACDFGHDDIALMLIENEADVNATDKFNRNILMYACIGGLHDIVSRLIEDYKFDVNATDKRNNKTPLMYACLNGHYEIANMLIKKKADINATDKDGKTAIHWACWLGRLECIKFLLSRGVSLTQNRDNDGKTPLDILKEKCANMTLNSRRSECLKSLKLLEENKDSDKTVNSSSDANNDQKKPLDDNKVKLSSIIKKHTPSLIQAICSNSDNIIDEMWAKNWITDGFRDTIDGINETEKTRKFLKELYNQCKAGVRTYELVQAFCRVLKNEGNHVLDTIADMIIDESKEKSTKTQDITTRNS